MKVDTNIIKMIVTYITHFNIFFVIWLKQKRLMETTLQSDSVYVKLMFSHVSFFHNHI